MRSTLLTHVLAALVFLLTCGAAFAAGAVVTHTHDSGPGSLRQAILDANASPGTITFQIPTGDPGFDGSTFTIQVLSPLPAIRHGVTLDGTRQTAFSGDTNPLGPEVVLDGSLLASGNGLTVSGDGNTVQGLVIQGFPGTGLAFSRLPFDPTPSNNRALDNYIGTDATGTVAVPNSGGLFFGGFGSPFAQARGNVAEGNLISGNRSTGIGMCDAADTRITGNLIGTDRTGTAALGNGGHGISMGCAGNPRTRIEGNVIAHNSEDGVFDLPDYRFGVAFTPDGHQGNVVRGNSIHGNGGLAINLVPPPFPPTEPASTPTFNDPCDPDGGSNLLQNFPEITRVEVLGGDAVVEGFLDSTPDRSFEVELYANAEADDSGFGEAETLLAATALTTGADCIGSFAVTVPAARVAGRFVTATATDAAGNTSELSPAFAVDAPRPNQPPAADAGPDQTVAAGEDCRAEVVLDGSASSDPDGDPLSFLWEGSFGTAEGATPTVELPLGSHTISLTVEDGRGGSGDDEVEITVVDATPPELLSLAASPALLWPPDHRMIAVEVTAEAADACDTAPECRITAVGSSEPTDGTGDGDTAPDWVLTGDGELELRAERSGGGVGRLYTLAVTCTDAAGNAAAGTVEVVVPHDRGKGRR
jgi:hypothetical protein